MGKENLYEILTGKTEMIWLLLLAWNFGLGAKYAVLL
jgi:hypothetical protein